MRDSALHAIHQLHRNVHGQILSEPIRLIRRNHALAQLLGQPVNRHPRLLKCGNNALARLGGERGVDKHRLRGIADARATCLAVHGQRNRLIHICFPIHIQVAITRARLNRRDRGIFHHRRNQTSTTPRNHHIHQTPGGNQILDTLPSLARQQLHHLAGKTMLRQRFLQDLHQLLVGMPR